MRLIFYKIFNKSMWQFYIPKDADGDSLKISKDHRYSDLIKSCTIHLKKIF